MLLEIGAPASLPLAAIRFESGAAALLGVTLQHPPLNLAARPGEVLSLEGARAEFGYPFARRFLAHHRLPERGLLEIELAIPSHMGLGSDAVLALGVAEALAWLHDRPRDDPALLGAAAGLGPEWAFETHAYAQGGVLLVEASGSAAPAVLRRRTLAHRDDSAWVFVLYLPRVPAGAPDRLEPDRRAVLLSALPHLSPDTGRLLETVLWPALEADDVDAFGRALRELQALNAQALAAAGLSQPLPGDLQALLDLCAAEGAAAWGRSLGGFALFALIRGKSPAVALRQKLVARVGYHGGTVMTAICDNQGARRAVHAAPPIYTGASPLVTGKPPKP